MKDQLKTIREFIESVHEGEWAPYAGRYEALTALSELEAMAGEQEQSFAFYKRRCDALQQWQSKMRDPERTIVCDILANGCTLEPSGNRYATPPAQQPLGAYQPDKAAVHSACDILTNIRDAYDSWGGWSGTKQQADKAINLLRYGSGVEAVQQPQADDYKGWYCAHCQCGVDGSEVTFHERHTVCGRVITDDRPPQQADAVPAELRDSLVAISQAIADQDDRAAQAMIREILTAPQQAEAVPAWTTEQITAVAQPIALEIAENCKTAPQLVFPHLFLGLKDLLTAASPQQAEAVPGDVVRDAERLRGLHRMTALIDTPAGDAYQRAMEAEVEKVYGALCSDLSKSTIEQYRQVLDAGLDAAAMAQGEKP